jgi:hypothetical protein
MKRHIANTFITSNDAVTQVDADAIDSIQSSREVTRVRHQAIQEAAYWRASERGFASGGELDDWLGAEANIDGVRSDNVLDNG